MIRRLCLRLRRLLGTSLALCAFASASHAADLVIGQVVPSTSVLASSALELSFGVRLYLDQVNAAGGINGQRLRHVVRDDEFKPELTLQRTREVLAAERPVALIGYIGTENVLRLSREKVLAEARIAMVAPLSGARELREPPSPNIFHVRAGYAEEATHIVRHLHSLGLTRLALFRDRDPLGESAEHAIREAARRLSMTLVASTSYERQKADDVAAAVKTIAASDAQAVVMVAISRAAGNFIKQLRDAGKPLPLYEISVVNIPDLLKIAGVESVRGLGVSQVMPDPASSRTAISREYQTALRRAAPDMLPSAYALEGYIGAKVLVEGLRRAGPDPSPEKVIKALETLRDFDLGDFRVTFGPGRREGSNYVDIAVVDRNGRLVR